MRIIRKLLTIILLSVSMRHGSCTPTRIILDGSASDHPAPALTAWDPWDTYGGLFSPRTPQFDIYRPIAGQRRNFGIYSFREIDGDRLRMLDNPRHSPRILETRCNNLDDWKKQNFLTSLGFDTGVRCRRTIREWMLQEPMYVEEPGWLPLEIGGDSSENPALNEDDPFILARGKRSADKPPVDSASERRQNSSRTKREVRAREDVNANGESDESVKSFYRKLEKYLAASSGYLQPRNKHSDIMDILNEPFFISRGKKSRDKRHYQGVANFEFHSGSSSGNYRPRRDRRGEIMEQLLKEQDPFYIARGKRSTNDPSVILRDWKK